MNANTPALIFQKNINLEVVDNDIITLSIDDDPNVSFSVTEQVGALGRYDYNELKNLPTLDGEVFCGPMKEKDPTVPEWAKKPSRPVYNADDVGAVSKDDVKIISEKMLNEIWNSF